MKNIKKFLLPITMASLLAGCQVTVPPANNQNSNNNSTNATTLTILDAKALKGSEKLLCMLTHTPAAATIVHER